MNEPFKNAVVNNQPLINSICLYTGLFILFVFRKNTYIEVSFQN